MVKLIVSALIVLGSSVQASQLCNNIADVAETTMELRQAGVPLTRVLEVMGDTPFYMAMAVQAYKQPLWNSESLKARTIAEYRNEWHLACLEGGA